MASKTEVQGSPLDTVKLTVSVVLLLAGIVAYYYYAEASHLLRVLGLLTVVAVSIGIASTTAKGQALWAFMQDARAEVRKMVWPSRAETVQTTLVVFLVVILAGVFFWILDMLLGWLVQFVI